MIFFQASQHTETMPRLRKDAAGILSGFVYMFILYFVRQIEKQMQVFCLALYHLYVCMPFFVLRQIDQQISSLRDC